MTFHPLTVVTAIPQLCTKARTLSQESHSRYLCSPEHVKYCCPCGIRKAWSYTFRVLNITEHTLGFALWFLAIDKNGIQEP